MVNIMKKSLLTAMAVLCLSAAGDPVQAASAAAEQLVSPALIDRAGWTWNWQVQLPVRADEAVDRMFVFEDYLYVMTDSNLLFCLDRATGAMRFITPLSAQRLPVCDPAYREKKLWFLVGNEMVVVDPWAGVIAERHRFTQIGNTVECGLALNDTHIYITGSDRRLHVFSRDGYWRPFTATADNDSAINSLAVSEGVVLFATEAGNVVCMAEANAEKKWQFDATGAVRSRLVVSEGMAYVGSYDTKLYKLDVLTGRLAWPNPFPAGVRIKAPVVLGKDVVYLPAGAMGVYGLRKDTGAMIWQVTDGIGVMTETDTQSFVLSRPGLLKVMDNKTGRQVYSVNFNQVTRFAPMMNEPKLYAADKHGAVAAITVR